MKYILTILIFALGISSSFSQGLFKYFKWTAYSDGPERIDHVVLNFNYNHLLDFPSGFNQFKFNLGVDAYAFHDRPINKKSTLALAIGIGYSGFNLRHDASISYVQNDQGKINTVFTAYNPDLNIRENKLHVSYLELPLELRIRSMRASVDDKNVSNFRLYLGFKAGWMVSNHTKYIDSDTKIKVYRIKNMLDYRYGPTVRIGFKKIALFGFYSMTPLFETGRGPQVYPVSVGFTWMRL